MQTVRLGSPQVPGQEFAVRLPLETADEADQPTAVAVRCGRLPDEELDAARPMTS